MSDRAWIIFSGRTDLWWLHMLKPGFRHCFILINDGDGWLSFDPMLHYIELKAHRHVAVDFNLPEWLENKGLIVVSAKMDRSKKRPAPLSFISCVSITKRILGMHDRFIFTPYQLYKHLKKEDKMGSLTSRPILPRPTK